MYYRQVCRFRYRFARNRGGINPRISKRTKPEPMQNRRGAECTDMQGKRTRDGIGAEVPGRGANAANGHTEGIQRKPGYVAGNRNERNPDNGTGPNERTTADTGGNERTDTGRASGNDGRGTTGRTSTRQGAPERGRGPRTRGRCKRAFPVRIGGVRVRVGVGARVACRASCIAADGILAPCRDPFRAPTGGTAGSPHLCTGSAHRPAGGSTDLRSHQAPKIPNYNNR